MSFSFRDDPTLFLDSERDLVACAPCAMVDALLLDIEGAEDDELVEGRPTSSRPWGPREGPAGRSAPS
jgi:hypothetical protein